MSSVAYAQPLVQKMQPRAETHWRYGTERSLLMSEIWAPLQQDQNSVFYTSIRLMGDDQENREWNLGFGHRHLTENNLMGSGIFGAHLWADRRTTERESTFYQTTLGLEWLGTEFDILANIYNPLSGKNQFNIPNPNPQAPALIGTGIFVDTNGIGIEEPQHGFDFELGWETGQRIDFFKNNTDSARFYLGGFYFNSDNTNSIKGIRARAAIDITPDVQVGGRVQYDTERGSQGFLEATIRFPFGQKRAFRDYGVRARLDESPERDIDIVTGSAIAQSGSRVQITNAQTGQPQTIIHVNNEAGAGGDGSAEAPFNNLTDAQNAANNNDIVYIHTGDGMATGQNTGITLNRSGQKLIGAGTDLVFDMSKFGTANGLPPVSTILIAASTAPVISNNTLNGHGIDITASNITVSGVVVDNANGDGINIDADNTDIESIKISNVTVQNNNRHGIYIRGANDGNASALIEKAVITGNARHGVVVYDDTDGSFEVDLGGGAQNSTGMNILSGNTLEDLAVDYDGRTLAAQNNWWGQASGPDTDNPGIGIAPQIYYGVPIDDGLIGHWTFDTEWMDNTTAYDRSGNGYDGTLQGGLSFANVVDGVKRQALLFDGGEITLGSIPAFEFTSTDSFSIFNYAEPDNTNTRGYSFAMNSTGSFGFGFFFDFENDRIALTRGNASSSYSSNAVFTDTGAGWVNAAAVYDSSNISYYRNGAAAGTSGHTFTQPVGNIARIGDRTSGNSAITIYDGKLDDIRVYNRVLTTNEILELSRMNTDSVIDTSNSLTSTP